VRARTWRHVRAACLLAAALVAPACHAADHIIYCDARAQVSGAGDGTSWTNAYGCLQNALAAATPGTEIQVAQGRYQPDLEMVMGENGGPAGSLFASGRRDVSFVIPRGVTVKGGYAGCGAANTDERDIDAYETILSGDLQGNDIELKDCEWQGIADYVIDASLTDNSHHVVVIVGRDEGDSNQANAEPVLDGLTITGGFADGEFQGQPGGGEISAPLLTTDGAGALIDSGAPTFIHCTFYRNVSRAGVQKTAGGAGAACTGPDADPTFRACTFKENIVFGPGAARGGGALVGGPGGKPDFVDCTFTGNVVAGEDTTSGGGALAVSGAGPLQLTGCRFEGNQALGSKGGAVFNRGAVVDFENCAFEDNAADSGGAAYNEGGTSWSFIGCLFLYNRALNGGDGGAMLHNGATVTVGNCRFVGNSAEGRGGAISGNKGATVLTSVFTGNSARRGGAFFNERGAELSLCNCTTAANRALEFGGAVYGPRRGSYIRNCIFWGDTPDEAYLTETGGMLWDNDIEGSAGGLSYSMDADPQFRDPVGPDGLAGTMDDDLRLCLGSPCIDAGDSQEVSQDWLTDLDGSARVAGNSVDMGAYEFHGPFYYYVDAAHGNDSNGGGSPRRAFATIQKGIDVAQPGYTVLVLPGLYVQGIDFKGKAITVSGLNGAPILEAPGDYGVSFYSAEGPESILRNFVICNCAVGVFVTGSAPTIRNVTLARNGWGIAAYAGAHPVITNCILWDNAKGDLFGCKATYSCVQYPEEGPGNISVDPLFADADHGDFHLLSEYGRYVPAYGLWSFDSQTSPCIDAGDPNADAAGERSPNGARINMGAFGGTPEASLSPCPHPCDEVAQAIETPVPSKPPQPDPAQWDPNGLPAELPGVDLFDCYVEMKAVRAVSPAGPVQYYFECLEQAAFNSGWQEECVYKVFVGRRNAGFRFRVRVCDGLGNVTGWSSWERAIPRAGR
jgi:predicted outer membrane repeat protein